MNVSLHCIVDKGRRCTEDVALLLAASFLSPRAGLAVHLPHGTDDAFFHPAHFASAASCFVCSAFCPAHVPCSVTTVLVVRGLLLLAPFT
ncbi:hypothetical protein CB1_001483001 [Camelus ferus]|nr:hypothetical protein CB1_001483001 [Camelus ferus]